MNIFNGVSRFSWGEVVYNPHATYGPRLQAYFQLVLVHAGSAEIQVEEETIRIAAGEAALLIPGREEFFRFSPRMPTRHSWIHVDFEADPDVWKTLREGPTAVRPIGGRMDCLMAELLKVDLAGGLIQRQLGDALAQAVLLDFFDRAGFSFGAGEPGHPAVQRALAHIRQGLAGDLQLAGIARVAGMSPQHLTRLFRTELGHTPVSWLWRLRESEGRRLLRETGLTITEISERCGFQNPFHFTRRIKRRYGLPPRALRMRHWGRTGGGSQQR